jgi:hypothetical protein
MRILIVLLGAVVVLAGCGGSGKRETVAGQEIQRTMEEACVHVANDFKLPADKKCQIVVGPIVSYDPRDNKERVVGLSEKFGRTLHNELARRGPTMVEQKDLHVLLSQQKMTMSALFADRYRIGGLLKADYIVVGSIVSEDKQKNFVTLALKCDKVEEGRTIVTSTVNLDMATSGISIDDLAVRNVRCSDTNCRICAGAGFYNCQQCNGSGYLEAPHTCAACNGQGFAPCMQCSQTGKCQLCQGSGYVAGVICTACSGGGGCPTGCEGGRLKCSACQGKGQITKLCRNSECKNGKIEHLVPQE